MEQYLLNLAVDPARTLISRHQRGTHGGFQFDHPSVSMYCLSWDLAVMYASQIHAVLPELDPPGDPGNWIAHHELFGYFLVRANVSNINFIAWKNRVSYDVGEGEELSDKSHIPNPLQGINPYLSTWPELQNEAYVNIVAAYEAMYLPASAEASNAERESRLP